MDTVLSILHWIAANIVDKASILLGLVAMVGLLIQKKGFSDVVLGTLKTVVGFLILEQGTNILVSAIFGFQPLFESVFGVKAAGLGGAYLDEFISKQGGNAALIMTFGFLINVLLARVTKFKYIYLTGHLMYWISLLIPAILLEVKPDASQGLILLVGSLICGVYWTLQPAYIQPLMRKVTGHDEIALGHTSSSNAFLSGILGKYMGKPEDSTEKVKLPKWMEFFRDVTAGTAFMMGILLIVLAVIAVITGASGTATLGDGLTYIITNGFMQAVMFAAGLTVMLFGVRMVIGEIIPAFRGIAMKVVPNAKPALDCPVIYDYAPTAVVIGFLAATVTFFVLMVIIGPVLKWTTILPPFLMLFFLGAVGGVFGNSTGGVKGAIFGGALTGAMLGIGQAIVTPMLSTTAPELAMIADPDWYFMVLILKPIFNLIF
ncbi:MAG: PTS ascorbate transporter subunit IIC [Chloroflexi bacterium]|nr:PTS ascorbate transporter subunit IIC [Chloroflexota bacterium]